MNFPSFFNFFIILYLFSSFFPVCFQSIPFSVDGDPHRALPGRTANRAPFLLQSLQGFRRGVPVPVLFRAGDYGGGGMYRLEKDLGRRVGRPVMADLQNIRAQRQPGFQQSFFSFLLHIPGKQHPELSVLQKQDKGILIFLSQKRLTVRG